MRITHVRIALVLAAAVAAASAPATSLAQSRPPASVIEVTPYAGYMRIANYADGPFGTDLSNRNGYLVGAQLAFRLTPNVAVIGNLARAGADLQVGVPILGGIGVGSSTLWLYDAGLQLGIPGADRGGVTMSPFVQLGAGAIHHDIGSSLIRSKSTNLAYNAGVGADIMFGRSIGLRLLARDYIGRFDSKEAIGFDLGTDMRHNIALSAGVTLAF